MTTNEFIEIMSNTTWHYGPGDTDSYKEESGLVNEFLNHIDLPEKDETLKDIYEIRYALLQALNVTGELRVLYNEITGDNDLYNLLPTDLQVTIKDILNPKIKSESNQHRNEPISVILDWYNDKKSKKVTYARKQLIDRFDGQSYSYQKKILKYFLVNGNAKDREWAAKRIYHTCDSTLNEPLRTAWEKYHEKSVGISVLKYLPESYTVKQIKQFEQAGLERKYIFAKLGNAKGFPYEISLNTLPWIDYFYVMAKLERPVQEAMAQEIMVTELSRATKKHFEEKYKMWNTDNFIVYPGITSYKDMGLLIWSFGKLGLTKPLLSLLEIAKKAQSFKSNDVHEYSLKLNHLLVGENRPLPLFGDLWTDPSLFEDGDYEDYSYLDELLDFPMD